MLRKFCVLPLIGFFRGGEGEPKEERAIVAGSLPLPLPLLPSLFSFRESLRGRADNETQKQAQRRHTMKKKEKGPPVLTKKEKKGEEGGEVRMRGRVQDRTPPSHDPRASVWDPCL